MQCHACMVDNMVYIGKQMSGRRLTKKRKQTRTVTQSTCANWLSVFLLVLNNNSTHFPLSQVRNYIHSSGWSILRHNSLRNSRKSKKLPRSVHTTHLVRFLFHTKKSETDVKIGTLWRKAVLPTYALSFLYVSRRRTPNKMKALLRGTTIVLKHIYFS